MKRVVRHIEVLVADRDVNIRSALKLLLINEHNNINITEAVNIENLQQLTGCRTYNLVIVDWSFSHNDTGRLIYRFRETQPSIIIIVLSKRREDKAAALEAGANAFVYKGDPPENLYNTLLTYLDVASTIIAKTPSVIPPRPRPIYLFI